MLTPVRLLPLLLAVLPVTLQAQSTQADLEARLLHEPLVLRGTWKKDKLHFDATGTLVGDQAKLPFTLCGFNISKVTLQPDKLVLDGTRVGIVLKDGVQDRVELTESGSHRPEHLHIEIDAAANYASVLTTIFAPSLAAMVPTLPSYWQPYAQAHFLTQPGENVTPTTAQLPHFKAATVGGAVLAPQALHYVEPYFTEAARQLHLSGNVVLSIVVTDQGNTDDVTIIRPLGLGLDEAAVSSISQYTFKPATKEGKPIAVELSMNVNFQIYQGARSR